MGSRQQGGGGWRGWCHDLPQEKRPFLPIKPLSALDLTPPHPPRYRKVVSNVCEGGVDLQQSPVQLQCPLQAPRGLQVSIRGEAVAVRPREDVLFVVRQEQVSIRPGLSLSGQFQPGTQGWLRTVRSMATEASLTLRPQNQSSPLGQTSVLR